jgi:O-antigen ligase
LIPALQLRAGAARIAAAAIPGFIVLSTLSLVGFDSVVLVTFCLFSYVQFEPAPADLLFAVLLAVGLVAGKLPLKRLWSLPLANLGLWFFVLANLFAMKNAILISQALRYMMITLYLIAFLYFVKLYATSFRAVQIVVVGYVLSALMACLLGGLGLLGIAPFNQYYVEYLRVKGPFKDPNVMGPFLIPCTLLLIEDVVHPRFLKVPRAVKLFMIWVFLAFVLLSFSRAAYVSCAVSAGLYSLLTLRKSKSLLKVLALTALIVGLAGAAVLVANPPVKSFLLNRIQAYQPYDALRVEVQLRSMRIASTELLGIGPGQFELLAPTGNHSLYLRTLVDGGWLGFAGFLLFVGVVTAGLFRRAIARNSPRLGLSPAVLFASLVGLLINSFVIDTLHWRHFWLVLALAVVVASTQLEADG